MSNDILIVGEFVAASLSGFPKKTRKTLAKYQIVSKDQSFVPMFFLGSNKKRGEMAFAVAEKENEGPISAKYNKQKNQKQVVFTPSEKIVVVNSNRAEGILSEFFGILHGTQGSLPSTIPLPNLPNVGVEVKRDKPSLRHYTKNIDKNILSIGKSSKSHTSLRAMIYGPPSSGKSSTAADIAAHIGSPWVSISPRYLTIGGTEALETMMYVATIAAQRKLTIVFEDIDEMIGIASTGYSIGKNEKAASIELPMLYFVLDVLKEHPAPVLLTAAGKYPVDHIVSNCNAFFSMQLTAEDIKSLWIELCPTAKKMADKIAEEELPLAWLLALLNQATMIAASAKRKEPNDSDVAAALTCFGKREEGKVGFSSKGGALD